MRADYTLARLYIDASLSAGAVIDLPKAQAHYIATVMRKSVGDAVRLFNGDDGEWRARIVEAGKKAVSLSVETQLRAPVPVPDIWLLFAPVKRSRTDFIVEKATELGVSQIHPVITDRTQFPKLRLDRMEAQVIEAAEQTERLDIPAVFAPVKLETVLAEWDAGRTLIFADEAGGDTALETLQGLTGPAAVLIGPQGGFTDREREALRAKAFVRPVSLGPRILRADTAAVSLLTLYQAAAGDWC